MHFRDNQHPTTNPCGTDFDSDKSGTVLEVPGHLEGMILGLSPDLNPLPVVHGSRANGAYDNSTIATPAFTLATPTCLIII